MWAQRDVHGQKKIETLITVIINVFRIFQYAKTPLTSLGWNGAYGTKFWVDPKENMVEILIMQTPNPQIHHDFENAVMQALIE
jgi:CubicO group peptidase (beta-lactamase class C family)